MVEDKIVSQTTYESDKELRYSDFFKYLADICESLDIPTPILTRVHIMNFAKFNTVRFIPRDFAEVPTFDKLVLENIAAK